MARYTGTINDFEKYIGPRLRNIVQTSIAKKLRNDTGKCEMCGKKDDLHAAHKHGVDRKSLIKEALGKQCIESNIEDVDISLFEKKFRKLHNPPENIFKILCRQCHRKYDNVVEIITIEEYLDKLAEINTDERQVLPIEFSPNDLAEFKELLLIHRSALITIIYNGGNIEMKEWNASNITEKSDIIRNIRSRTEFRQGNWQNLNIKSVKVEINEIV